MLGDQSYRRVVKAEVTAVAGTSSMQATVERRKWHGDAHDRQRSVRRFGLGGGSLYADGARGLDTLNFQVDWMSSRTNRALIGVGAEPDLGRPTAVMQFDAEAVDAAQSSPGEAPSQHRTDPAKILGRVRRPKRFLIAPDSTLKIAGRAAPPDYIITADRIQCHPVYRAGRNGTIEFNVEERLQTRDEADPFEQVISTEHDTGA